MNILHMKYAVEVAKVGSLNKASETLLVATPNISRSIKELEGDLGINIFERTAKGVTLTPEGEEFISYAKELLNQIDQVENFYKKGISKKQKFSISVPRACYISDAFSENTLAIRVSGISSCLAIVTSTGRLCWMVGNPDGALVYGASFSERR
jgi:DNA-binding transcriptional LysR family regulator